MSYETIRNDAEIGRNFLNANRDKYALRLYDTETGNQGIELCRKNIDGEFQRIVTLDMAGIFSQCNPLDIVRKMNSDVGFALQGVNLADFNVYTRESANEVYENYCDEMATLISRTGELGSLILNDAMKHTPFSDESDKTPPDVPF